MKDEKASHAAEGLVYPSAFIFHPFKIGGGAEN
jgi:hypothetical protein